MKARAVIPKIRRTRIGLSEWIAAVAQKKIHIAEGLRWLLMTAGFIFGMHAAAGGPPTTADKIGVLEQARPWIRYSLSELDRANGEKFLLFDIFEVENPAAIPLAFTVFYQKPGQDRLYLGSFALYPADNPGRFIVPTQGKVGKDGEIVLNLVPLEAEEGAQSVRVKLREVKLIEQLNP